VCVLSAINRLIWHVSVLVRRDLVRHGLSHLGRGRRESSGPTPDTHRSEGGRNRADCCDCPKPAAPALALENSDLAEELTVLAPAGPRILRCRFQSSEFFQKTGRSRETVLSLE